MPSSLQSDSKHGADCPHRRVRDGIPYICTCEHAGQRNLDPPRGELPADVVPAAGLISRMVWQQPYVPGQGPMHMAGGSYWHDELLRRANQWERLAAAARTCAEYLPDA